MKIKLFAITVIASLAFSVSTISLAEAVSINTDKEIAHKVIQMPSEIRMVSSDHVNYSPGMLIGLDQKNLSAVKILYSSIVDDYQIIFGKLTCFDFSTVYVMLANLMKSGNTLVASTILIPDEDGSYLCAETTMASIQHVAEISSNVQDIITQTTPQTLSEHYASLGKCLLSIINKYSVTAQLKDTVHTYVEYAKLLTILRNVVTLNLSEYDCKITCPKAMVYNEQREINGLRYGICDHEQLEYGWADGLCEWCAGSAHIGSDLYLIELPPGEGAIYDMEYAGSNTVGSLCGLTSYNSDKAITSCYYNHLLGGYGSISATVNGNNALFSMGGIATWELIIDSYFNAASGRSFGAWVFAGLQRCNHGGWSPVVYVTTC